MRKTTFNKINLLINATKETYIVKRFRIILPVIAVVSVLLFIILFSSSLIMTNANLHEFNDISQQIKFLENRIASQKNSEGIYYITANSIKVIAKLLTLKRNFQPVFDQLDALSSTGIKVSSISTDEKGKSVLSIQASNSASLERFVENLLEIELKNERKTISDISSRGSVRDKNGEYLLSISFTLDPEIFQ